MLTLVVKNVLCYEIENAGVYNQEENNMGQYKMEEPTHHEEPAYQIPNTFVDVFKPGMSKKPTLG